MTTALVRTGTGRAADEPLADPAMTRMRDECKFMTRPARHCQAFYIIIVIFYNCFGPKSYSLTQ